ncbi:TIM barrel protein [Aminipila luticellarii]|uniref:AP endonuclease n=1 Tax=Aminipila luticellarii TaxID=2507160 RepID=A0A410PYM9_9FIRM|nr:TIM barrel protein [Aminipila luticellarii]QAT44082.1 AP endonuclease [Aminipila luticellarii]
MIQLINMPLVDDILNEYNSNDELNSVCRKYGCDGIEAIWGGEDCSFPVEKSLIRGWHLAFFCDWVDFWNKNEIELIRKFRHRETWETFYGGKDRNALLKMIGDDLDRADRAGAEYVVFHVSDVSVEEVYTYKWLHTDEEVVDTSAELINQLMDHKNYRFKLLLENLNWSGFTFTRPEITKRLLQKVHYKNKGIMLDIGHLMCTNPELQNTDQAIDYIHKMLDEHDILCRYIKGIHLHQSLSGDYVKENTRIAPQLPEDYWEKFGVAYEHILNIDTHKPVSNSRMKGVIARINPEYLVHELAASDRKEKERVLKVQTDTLLSY